MSATTKYLRLQECYRFLNCDVFSRCSNEGEAVLNAKHLIAWGRTESTGEVIKTIALCLKTSDLADVPHEIQGTFRISATKELVVLEMKCSCKAGESEKCKHIAAFLLLCTRNSVLEFSEFSCTDIKCYWNSNKESALEQYAPHPTAEWPCFKKKLPETKAILDQDTFNKRIEKALPHSNLALHSVGRREVPSIATKDVAIPIQLKEVVASASKSLFLAALDIDVNAYHLKICCKNVLDGLTENVDVADIATQTCLQIERWRCERQYRLTGARCYSIFTYAGDKWGNKAEKYFWPKSFTNKFVQHGVKYEKEALSTYKIRNKYEVYEPGFIVCKQYPWLGCTPDGIVMDKDGKPRKLVEIKCPFAGRTEPAINFIHTCNFLKLTSTRLELKQRQLYYGQVQLNMAILNLKETDFVLYSPFSKSFLNISVPFDDEFARKMIFTITEKYFSHMLHVICEKENVYNTAKKHLKGSLEDE